MERPPKIVWLSMKVVWWGNRDSRQFVPSDGSLFLAVGMISTCFLAVKLVLTRWYLGNSTFLSSLERVVGFPFFIHNLSVSSRLKSFESKKCIAEIKNSWLYIIKLKDIRICRLNRSTDMNVNHRVNQDITKETYDLSKENLWVYESKLFLDKKIRVIAAGKTMSPWHPMQKGQTRRSWSI